MSSTSCLTLSILALFAATAVASPSSDLQVLVAAVSHDKEIGFDSPPACELTSSSEKTHLNIHDLNARATIVLRCVPQLSTQWNVPLLRSRVLTTALIQKCLAGSCYTLPVPFSFQPHARFFQCAAFALLPFRCMRPKETSLHRFIRNCGPCP